jgi:hypothetical protein
MDVADSYIEEILTWTHPKKVKRAELTVCGSCSYAPRTDTEGFSTHQARYYGIDRSRTGGSASGPFGI